MTQLASGKGHAISNYVACGTAVVGIVMLLVRLVALWCYGNETNLRVVAGPVYYPAKPNQACLLIGPVRWKANQLVPSRLTPPSYSEYGQDVWIHENIIKPLHLDHEGGTFIEFGARDGIEGSNSYYFEKTLNWSGLLVEGLNREFKRLITNRPNPLIIKQKGLLCSKSGKREYLWATGDIRYQGWGGFKEELQRSGALEALIKAQKANPSLQVKSRMMECLSLNSLLDSAGMKNITLLSADCEGCELEVLKSLNWNAYVPTVILVEKAGDEKRLCEVIDLVMSKGYTAVNWNSSDVVFVRSEQVSKLPL